MSTETEGLSFAEPDPEDELIDIDEPGAVADVKPTDGALLDKLHRTYTEVHERHNAVFPLAIWGDHVGLRLKVLPQAQWRATIKAMGDGKNPDKLLRAGGNLLIAGLQEIVVRGDEMDPWEPLADDEGPCKLDERCAKLLQLGPVKSSRDVLVAMLQGKDRAPWAIAAIVDDYGSWMIGEAAEVASDTEKASARTAR